MRRPIPHDVRRFVLASVASVPFLEAMLLLHAHANASWNAAVKKAKNRNKSRIRARVEHVFAMVKRLWGFDKVRHRGLAKNATRAFVALAMANICLARGALLQQVRA